MKKVLLILAIAGFAVACNNDSDSKDAVVDSTINVIDSTAKAAKDSINTIVDSAKANIDSIGQ